MSYVMLFFDDRDTSWVEEIRVSLQANGIQIVSSLPKESMENSFPHFAILFLSASTIYSQIQESVCYLVPQDSLYIVLHSDVKTDTNFSIHLREYQRRYYFFVYPEGIEDLVNSIHQGIQPKNVGSYSDSKTYSIQDKSTDWQQYLRTAWVRITHDARHHAIYYDEFDFNNYEQNREANLAALRDTLQYIEQNELETERRHLAKGLLQPLFCLRVPKSNEREGEDRELYVARAETSILLQLICDLLSPILEAKFSDHSFANRTLQPPVDNLEIFHSWIESYKSFKSSINKFTRSYSQAYVYRGDIRRFYPSIDVERLLQRLLPYISQHEKFAVLWPLLQAFVHLQAINEKGSLENVPGLPAGIPLSHLLANFYLIDFDQRMMEFSFRGGYFRYADDVFIFFSTRTEVLAFKDGGFKAALPDILAPHPEKSDFALATDQTWLETMLDSISGQLQPTGYIGIDSSEQQQIRATLIELLDHSIKTLPSEEKFFETKTEFWAATDYEEALTRYGPLIIDRLRQLGQPQEDIDEKAFELLRVVPLRPHNIRRLLKYFVERLSDETITPVINRFLSSFLRAEAPNYVRIVFLQTLRNYLRTHNIDSEIVWSLVYEQYYQQKQQIAKQTKSDLNIFIFGEAALTLCFLPSALSSLFEFSIPYENPDLPGSFFSVSRDWYLFSQRFGIHSLTEATTEPIQNAEVLDVFLYIMQLGFETEKLQSLDSFEEILLQAGNTTLLSRSVVRYLKFQLMNSIRHSNWEAKAGLILEILHKSYTQIQTKVDILDYLSHSEIPQELMHYIVPARHILAFPSTQEILDHYQVNFQGAGKSHLYSLDKADYQVRFDSEEQPNFVIEIFRASLLQTNGFNVLQWEQLLIRLHRQKIIHLVEVVRTADNIVVIYRVPESYQVLGEKLRSEEKGISDVGVLGEALQILWQINLKAEAVSEIALTLLSSDSDNSFRFLTPFGDMVLLKSPIDNLLLTSIGASLVRTHTYVSAIGPDIEQANPDEIGFYAYTKFLGFLLFELVSGRSPTQELGDLQREKTNALLIDNTLIKEFSPHIVSLLLRLTHYQQQLRYQQYKDIRTDLSHIINFYLYQNKFGGDDAKILELVDYMGLRMRTHQRDPNFKTKAAQERLQYLLQSIRNDFLYYQGTNSERRHWLQKTLIQTVRETDLLDRGLLDWLHYTSRHLWQVQLLWLHCLTQWHKLPEHPQTVSGLSAISLAMLAEIIRVETLVYAQVIARSAKKVYINRTNFGEVDSILNNSPQVYVVDFSVDSRDRWPSQLYSNEILHRVKQMLDNAFVDSASIGIMDIAPRKQPLWLEELTLFILFMGDALELYDTDDASAHLIWTARCRHFSQPAHRNSHLLATKLINELLENVYQVCPSIEELSANFQQGNFDEIKYPVTVDILTKQVALILQKIRQANGFSNRSPARITDSHPQFKQGFIKSGNFVFGMDVTGEKHSFTQRDLVPETSPSLDGRPEYYMWAKADTIQGVNTPELAALVPYIRYFPALDKLARRLFFCYTFADVEEVKSLGNTLYQWGFDVRSYSDAIRDADWWEPIFREIRAAEIVLIYLPSLSNSDLSTELRTILRYIEDTNKPYIALKHGKFIETLDFSWIPTKCIHQLNSTSEEDILSLVEKLVETHDELVGVMETPAKPYFPSLVIVDNLVRPEVKLYDNELQENILRVCERAIHEKTISKDKIEQILLKFREHPNCQLKDQIDKTLDLGKTKGRWYSLSRQEKFEIIGIVAVILAALIGIIPAILNSNEPSITNPTITPSSFIITETPVPSETPTVTLMETLEPIGTP